MMDARKVSHDEWSTAEAWIQVASGRKFDILNPTLDMIEVDDIATALAKTCRYGGHTVGYYSVAEHSVVLSRQAPNKIVARHLLMHDAAEAYIGDIVYPLKAVLRPIIAPIEEKIEALIAERFGLSYPWPTYVKEYDHDILYDERIAFMGYTPGPYPGPPLEGWEWPEAYRQFMGRFEELFI